MVDGKRDRCIANGRRKRRPDTVTEGGGGWRQRLHETNLEPRLSTPTDGFPAQNSVEVPDQGSGLSRTFRAHLSSLQLDDLDLHQTV
ncbi:unnamed protein product [Taenia asiatica]|uniref:Uncharacterized protein n=1 Tax=Taenia asiatica TaxID=60517 RepID=A0A0R3W7R3_TAEAS|nr:unnamed protein product [Taenia asiatica]